MREREREGERAVQINDSGRITPTFAGFLLAKCASIGSCRWYIFGFVSTSVILEFIFHLQPYKFLSSNNPNIGKHNRNILYLHHHKISRSNVIVISFVYDLWTFFFFLFNFAARRLIMLCYCCYCCCSCCFCYYYHLLDVWFENRTSPEHPNALRLNRI